MKSSSILVDYPFTTILESIGCVSVEYLELNAMEVEPRLVFAPDAFSSATSFLRCTRLVKGKFCAVLSLPYFMSVRILFL